MSDVIPAKIKIYCDGGSRGNPGPSASAFVILNEQGEQLYSQTSYLGISTNNIAEYRAVQLAVLWLEKNYDISVGITDVSFFLDSLLVVNQLNNVYRVKDLKLKQIYTEVKRIIQKLQSSIRIGFIYIPRSENGIADGLVNETLDSSL